MLELTQTLSTVLRRLLENGSKAKILKGSFLLKK